MLLNSRSFPARTLLRGAAAFTVVEAIVSLAIGGLAISGAMFVNSQQLRLVKSTRDSSAASHSMQERVEQLRIATWRQITDPAYVSKNLLGTVPKSIAPLDTYRERITVQAWPSPDACEKLVVEKSSGSSATILSQGKGLPDLRLAKVDVQIRWKGGGRERTRELTTIISNGGVSRMNLPAMGSLGGGDWTGTAEATPAPATPTPTTTTIITTATPVPVTTTATPVPVSNKRGNVGGRVGRK